MLIKVGKVRLKRKGGKMLERKGKLWLGIVEKVGRNGTGKVERVERAGMGQIWRWESWSKVGEERHPLIFHSLPPSFTHSLIHSLIRSFTQFFFQPLAFFLPPLTHSLILFSHFQLTIKGKAPDGPLRIKIKYEVREREREI